MKRGANAGVTIGTMLGVLLCNSRAGWAILAITAGVVAYYAFLRWAGVFAARPKPGPSDG